ncbi:hypothetical protein GDO81_007638 [Engystomops pustulosus]|uniref:Uncharacterized protein n=1 Tax=Engystomops pustulosus TaxID=76066 RepID=A0AAV7C8K1_ENGPU|nr:hypothetical protein GDO81_007638 [Engystomops pustulosus]
MSKNIFCALSTQRTLSSVQDIKNSGIDWHRVQFFWYKRLESLDNLMQVTYKVWRYIYHFLSICQILAFNQIKDIKFSGVYMNSC